MNIRDLAMETCYKFCLSSTYRLNGKLFTPDNGEVKSVIVVVHGMTEHIGRYERFAEVMTNAGIAVIGYDLRGHGGNEGDENVASFDSGITALSPDYGWSSMLVDICNICKEASNLFENAKVYLMGFSLGSFLVRDFMNKYPMESIDGVILMGTGFQHRFVTNVMKLIVKLEVCKTETGQTTDMVRMLAFETYNKRFSPTESQVDWLMSDKNSREEYLADKLVRKDISADLFYDLICSMHRTCTCKTYKGVNDLRNMPILLLSGSEDPVGDMGKGVLAVKKQMEKAGLKNVKSLFYAGARHDILHECANGTSNEAMLDIIKWIGDVNVLNYSSVLCTTEK